MDEGTLYEHLFLSSFLISGICGIIFFFLFGSLLELGLGIFFVASYEIFFDAIFIRKRYGKVGGSLSYFMFLLNFLFGIPWLLLGFILPYTLVILGYAFIISGGFAMLGAHPEIPPPSAEGRNPSWKCGLVLGIIVAGGGTTKLGLYIMTGLLADLHLGISLTCCGGVMLGITLADKTLAFDVDGVNLFAGVILGVLNMVAWGIGLNNPFIVIFMAGIITYTILIFRRK